jgi:hypothetical protein
MTAARLMLAVLLLCGLAMLLVSGSTSWLAVTLGCAVSIEIFVRRKFRWLLPPLLFCLVLALLEWVGHHSVTVLPLKAFLSYAVLTLSLRIMPWAELLRSVSPQSWLFLPVLFLLFVRHFTSILRDEAVRSLTVYRLAVPHLFGHGGIRALAWSLDSFFCRSILRAERFYAAQLLRGLAE